MKTVRFLRCEQERISRVENGFHPDITLWPEDSYINDPHKTPHLWEKLSALPSAIHGYLLFGARDQQDPRDDAVFQKAAYLLDPAGVQIVQSVRTTDPTALDAVVGRQEGQTLFVRFGWRFGQLCLAVLLLLCLASLTGIGSIKAPAGRQPMGR